MSKPLTFPQIIDSERVTDLLYFLEEQEELDAKELKKAVHTEDWKHWCENQSHDDCVQNLSAEMPYDRLREVASHLYRNLTPKAKKELEPKLSAFYEHWKPREKHKQEYAERKKVLEWGDREREAAQQARMRAEEEHKKRTAAWQQQFADEVTKMTSQNKAFEKALEQLKVAPTAAGSVKKGKKGSAKKLSPFLQALENYTCLLPYDKKDNQNIYDKVSGYRHAFLMDLVLKLAKDKSCYLGSMRFLVNEKTALGWAMEKKLDVKHCPSQVPLQVVFVGWNDSDTLTPESMNDKSALERFRVAVQQKLEGHATAILIDNKHKILEPYDPHGYETTKSTNIAWREAIKVIEELFPATKDYEIEEAYSSCPLVPGMQAKYQKPWCVTFTLLYILMRILAPSENPAKLRKKLLGLKLPQIQRAMSKMFCLQQDWFHARGYNAASYLHRVASHLEQEKPTTEQNYRDIVEAEKQILSAKPDRGIELLRKHLGWQ